MRTCPACGKDTEAQTTEPCTECGFSPVGATEAPPEVTVGEAPPSGYGFPDEPEAPAPARKGSGVAPIWIVLIVVGLAWQAFNLLDGCGEIFADKPGPTPEETESALESDASRQGVASPTADCPDSAEDTEVGATFDCTVTTASGASATVTVTNREDSFVWSRAPLFRLARQG